jgi:hypothetical protein
VRPTNKTICRHICTSVRRHPSQFLANCFSRRCLQRSLETLASATALDTEARCWLHVSHCKRLRIASVKRTASHAVIGWLTFSYVQGVLWRGTSIGRDDPD